MRIKLLTVIAFALLFFTEAGAQAKLDFTFNHSGKYYGIKSFDQVAGGKFLIAHLSGSPDSLLIIDAASRKPVKLKGVFGTVHSFDISKDRQLLFVHAGDISASTSSHCFIYNTDNFSLRKVLAIGKAIPDTTKGSYYQPSAKGYQRAIEVTAQHVTVINFLNEILKYDIETGKEDNLCEVPVPPDYYLNQYDLKWTNGILTARLYKNGLPDKILWFNSNTKTQKIIDVRPGFEIKFTALFEGGTTWFLAKEADPAVAKNGLLIGLNMADGSVIQESLVQKDFNRIIIDQTTGKLLIASDSEAQLWVKNASGADYLPNGEKINVGQIHLSFAAGKNAIVTTDYFKFWVYDMDSKNEALTVEIGLDGKEKGTFAAVTPVAKADEMLYVLGTDNAYRFQNLSIKYNQPSKLATSETVAQPIINAVVSKKPSAPHLVIQQGHTNKPTNLVYATTRPWIISGDEAGSIVFWDKRSMLQVKKIQMKRDDITQDKNDMYLALHPTKEIIAVSWGYGAIVWIDFDGNELNRLETDGQSPIVHFSEDGKYFFYTKERNKLSVLDLEKGSLLSTYDFNTEISVLNFAFNGDSKKIALPYTKGIVKIIDALTGNVLQELQTAHKYNIRRVTYHPKLDVIATLSEPLEVCFTNITTKASKNVLSKGTPELTKMIWGMVFTPQNELILSGPLGSNNNGSTHNLFSGSYLPGTNDTGGWTFYRNVAGIQLSLGAYVDPEGKMVCTTNVNGAIEVWDIGSKSHIKSLAGSNEHITGILVPAKFNGLLIGTSGSENYHLRKLDFGAASVNVFNGIKMGTETFHENENGTFLSSFAGQVKTIDLKTDSVLLNRENNITDRCIGTTPYGAVLYGGGTLSIMPKDRGPVKVLYKFAKKEDNYILWQNEYGARTYYSFDKSGRRLFFFDLEKFHSFDLVTGKHTVYASNPLLKQLNAFKVIDEQLLLALKNSLYLYSPDQDKMIELTNAAGNDAIFSDGLYKPAIGLSSSGKVAISFALDTISINGAAIQRLKLFKPGSTVAAIELPVTDAPVTRLEFSADEKLLYVVYTDQIQIINIEKRALIATMAMVYGGKFILFTPDNYYYASPKFSNVGFNIDDRIYDITQFDLKFNRPDIVLERLGYASKELIGLYKRAYEKRLARLNVREDQLTVSSAIPQLTITNKEQINANTTLDVVELNIEAKKGNLAMNTMYVLVNDVPVDGVKGVVLNPGAEKINISRKIKLVSGSNQISIYVTDVAGAASLKENMVINYNPKDTVISRTWFVGAGVSTYRDTTYNLTYADKDIKDLEKIFKGKNANTFVLLNSLATADGLKNLKKELMNTKVDDVVILSLSGHGLVNKNGDFYFAGYETDFKNPEKTGISFTALEWLLDSIPARRKLLMIDACHSGELEKDITIGEAKEQPMEKEVKATKKGIEIEVSSDAVGLQNSYELMKELFTDLSRSNGAEVISAAGGLEFAFENAQYSNGVFTYCLKKALLENAADADKNKSISIKELKAYMIREVSRLTGGRQKPTIRQEAVSNDWKVW